MDTVVFSNEKELDAKIFEWITYDQYEETKSYILKLVDEKKWDLLKILLMSKVKFGTAGIRSKMEAGFSRINDLIIIQTCQGLAKYLISNPQIHENILNETAVRKSGVVIGYDGRFNSYRFAQRAAAVFNELNFKIYMFSKPVPTPFIPFSIKYLKCSAGIVITASHNPKNDNGIKVYLANGCQIISPHDFKIQEEIKKNLEPWKNVWNLNVSTICKLDELEKAYMENIIKKSILNFLVVKENLENFRITYTSLHGVGHPYVTKAFEILGLKQNINIFSVKEQENIDPNFSTVSFPNPEEGASVLDLSFKTADKFSCDLIIANDPDTDRCSIAERQGNGLFKQFTGNEIGTLLGWFSWFKYCLNKNPNEKCYMMSSTVSSHFLETMSKVEKFEFIETLTGFKWMGNVADKLLKANILSNNTVKNKVLFAFEEAIGFMMNSNVLDKDGISAAIEITQLALYLNKKLKTNLNNFLFDTIYFKYGYHFNMNSYYLCYCQETIKKIFYRIFHYNNLEKVNYPWEFGGYKVTRIRDLYNGYDNYYENLKPIFPVSSSSFMITFYFSEKTFVTIRTSGTEPKIKYYSEIISEPEERNYETVKHELNNLVQLVIQECLQPDKNKLTKPKI